MRKLGAVWNSWVVAGSLLVLVVGASPIGWAQEPPPQPIGKAPAAAALPAPEAVPPTTTPPATPATPATTEPAAESTLAPSGPLPTLTPVQRDTADRPLTTAGQGQVLTLEEAFRRARNHPGLKAGREQLAQAELVKSRVWTGWLPTLNAIGMYTHYDSEIAMGFPMTAGVPGVLDQLMGGDATPIRQAIAANAEAAGLGQLDPDKIELAFSLGDPKMITLQQQESFAGVLDLKVPLFIGPLLPEFHNADDLLASAQQAYRYQEKSFLLMPIGATYYGAVAAVEAREIARQTLETSRRHYEAMARMFEVGQATKLAVLQSEIAVVQAQQKLAGAETGVRTSLRALQLLLGLEQPIQVQHPPLPAAPAGDEATLFQLARQHREDYRAAELQLRMARRGDEKALWKYAPVLMGSGQYRITNSESFNGENSAWQLGLTLSIPLFDGGSRRVDRIEAASKLRQAEENISALENRIVGEINEKLKAVEGYETDLVTMRHTVALAREGVGAARASFEVGMATNLDVLDANQKQFEAEMGLVMLQIQLDLARLQLAHVIGLFDPLAQSQGR